MNASQAQGEVYVTAFKALPRPDAIEALGAYKQGDFIRLELDYCPSCFEETRLKVVNVHDLQQKRKRWLERVLWAGHLDESSTRSLLQLEN